jgi:hypothetical protein
VFTARYELSLQIRQIQFRSKGLIHVTRQVVTRAGVIKGALNCDDSEISSLVTALSSGFVGVRVFIF